MITRSAGERIRVIRGRSAVHCVQPAVARADACVKKVDDDPAHIDPLKG